MREGLVYRQVSGDADAVDWDDGDQSVARTQLWTDLPSRKRVVERRPKIYQEAQPTHWKAVSIADGSGMGIRGPERREARTVGWNKQREGARRLRLVLRERCLPDPSRRPKKTKWPWTLRYERQRMAVDVGLVRRSILCQESKERTPRHSDWSNPLAARRVLGGPAELCSGGKADRPCPVGAGRGLRIPPCSIRSVAARPRLRSLSAHEESGFDSSFGGPMVASCFGSGKPYPCR